MAPEQPASKPPGKKLFIRTYGCQMNVYDSSRMADVLAPMGYSQTETPDDADMVILNTCHIREKAAEKVFSDLGRLRPLKRQRDMIIAVAGCVAQAEGAEIMARATFVDIVVGPQAYHRLPEMILEVQNKRRVVGVEHRVVDTEFPVISKFDLLPAPRQEGPTAFLSVQEGCDKFCTFCVVPYTRGAEYSRPVDAILAEARGLVAQGAREITLLGQNVNAYHGATAAGETWGLGSLVKALAEIPDLARIRYTTSHPRDMDEGLMAAHRDVAKLMPFLHLPVQSGSDTVLKAMNRGHTRADYLRIVETLRKHRPDIALSSDFIVGFPGETDADFAATLSLAEEVGYAQCYTFKYSPRPGTPASTMSDQVPEEVASARLTALQELITRQMRAFLTASVGCTFDVLLTGPGRNPGQLSGRSPYLQPVHVTADPSLIGSIVPLEIVSVDSNSLGAVRAGAGRVAASR